MKRPRRVFYGGQAVMEGVLMRGQALSCVAVRRPDGEIVTRVRPVGMWAESVLRRIPFLRGVLVLAESLVLGMGALQWSANVSMDREHEELSGRQMIPVVLLAVLIAALFFFALPAGAAGSLAHMLPGPLVHLLEGCIRIVLLLGYLFLIGRMPDVERLFAYHGAEHMTIHAYEAGVPLDPAHVRRFDPAHPRCGTSFLLLVMVVSVFVFAFLGDPPLVLRVLSRILLMPLVAAVSYEVLRLGATHAGSLWSVLVVKPGLALQRLTTRRPDDSQIEVALHAFTTLRDTEAAAGLPLVAAGSEPEINA